VVFDIPLPSQRRTKSIQETHVDYTQRLLKTSLLLHKRHTINKVCMTRLYTPQHNNIDTTEMNTKVDAIMCVAASTYNIPSMALIGNGSFIVTYKKAPIQITNEVFLQIDALEMDPKTNDIVKVQVSLLSNSSSASELATYVENVYASYSKQLMNSLDNGLYMFYNVIHNDTQIPLSMSKEPKDSKAIRSYKRLLIKTAPKHLQFTKMAFYSNKQFNNIYGYNARYIQKRLQFFLNNKSWYDAKGIPYQLGIMLSGLPGTGKTSLIRAIANMTKRHIIHVNFTNITTATQLKNIFHNTTLIADGKPYHIPIEKRLYVFEEIDTFGSVLYKRDPTKLIDDSEKETDVAPDELTLGEVLTVLDGILEIPGRLLIMTTNHPEVLDPALLRPGRIDINVCFGNASRDLIIEMFEALLDIKFPFEWSDELPDMVLTPAEVSEVLINLCTCRSDGDSHAIVARFLDDLKTYVADKQPEDKHAHSHVEETIAREVMGAPMNMTNEEGAPTTSTIDIRNIGSSKHSIPTDVQTSPTPKPISNLLDRNQPLNRHMIDETIDSLNIYKKMAKCYGYITDNKTMHVTNPTDISEIKQSLAKLYTLGYTDNELFDEMLLYTSTDTINKMLAHKLKTVTSTLHTHTNNLPMFQDFLNKTREFHNVYGIRDKLAIYASVLLDCYAAYTQHQEPIHTVHAKYDAIFTEFITRGINNRSKFVTIQEVLRDICDFFQICEALTEKGECRILKKYPRSIGYICTILFVDLIQKRFNNTSFGTYCTFGISHESHVQPIQNIMKYMQNFQMSLKNQRLDDEKVHSEISKQCHFFAMKQVLQQYDADIHQRITYEHGTGSGLDTFFDGNWLSMM